MQQREKAWFASSPKSRLQYLGPNPGFPSLDEKPSQEFFLDPSAGPVDAFCLLVLDPEQVGDLFYPVLFIPRPICFTPLNLKGLSCMCTG